MADRSSHSAVEPQMTGDDPRFEEVKEEDMKAQEPG